MDKPQTLWQQLIAPENLWRAYVNAKKGKSRRPDVAKFSMQVEIELADLRDALLDGSYRPAGYRQFYVHDRKRRLISAAPFRDRVLHHALMQIIEPLLEQRFSDHSWACRKGKGTHVAVRQYQKWARRYTYALKMDVAEYFHSIDHQRLMHKLAAVIHDEAVLRLMGLIIGCTDAPRGLPIGNLTSQIWGNWYLNDLDHFITDTLGFSAYLRYVDDMVILADDKQALWSALLKIQQKLAEEGLLLHPRKVYLTQTRYGLDVLGYRVYPRFIQLRHENGYRFRRRFKRRIRAFERGDMTWDELGAGVQAWLGHARQADSYGLRKALFSNIVIHAGASEHAVGARRCVEQQTVESAFRQPEQEQAR